MYVFNVKIFDKGHHDEKEKPSKIIPVYSMPYDVFDPDSPVWH